MQKSLEKTLIKMEKTLTAQLKFNLSHVWVLKINAKRKENVHWITELFLLDLRIFFLVAVIICVGIAVASFMSTFVTFTISDVYLHEMIEIFFIFVMNSLSS